MTAAELEELGRAFEVMFWLGVALAVVGVGGLVGPCVVAALRVPSEAGKSTSCVHRVNPDAWAAGDE